MNITPSANFRKTLEKQSKKNKTIRQKVNQKLELFLQNPKHPSLRLHKLEGDLDKTWSISIDSSLRILFDYDEDGILLLDIGKHEKVY